MAKAPGKAASGKTSAPSINIGISDKDRAAIAQGLSRLLADTYTLYLTTHNFHWNVTGPMFNTLHTMFMAQYTELWNAGDPIAERIRPLGHVAPSSPGTGPSTRPARGRPRTSITGIRPATRRCSATRRMRWCPSTARA